MEIFYNGISGLISIAIGIYFVIHGTNSLRGFSYTMKLIQREFVAYSKRPSFDTNPKNPHPYIFILVPVFREQRMMRSLLENLSRLDYHYSRYEVVIITTEKEYYCREKKFDKTTIEILDEYLQTHKLPNFSRVHYPFVYGHKTDQLNYAFNILKKKHSKSFLNEAFFCIFDADTLIHKNILKIFTNSLKENPLAYVFQQPNLWLKNFNDLPKNFNGYLMKSFALLHTYYSLSYEVPMIARPYKFPYQMKYCLGNGLFIKGKVFERIKNFPSLIEDTRIGHICSFLKINISLLPVFGITGVTNNFIGLLKQISVWFTGEILIIKDFFFARSIKKELNLFYAFFILLHKALKNFSWMNQGLLFLIGLSLALFLRNPLIIALYFMSLLANIWIPTFLILKQGNRLLNPFYLSIEKPTVLGNLILPFSSLFIFCFSFLGPYLGIFRIIKSSINRKLIILPKTER